MSAEVGRRGSIYRVTLENFVTFGKVEFFPGQNLNLVIGPNGSGKSTFICAIVLGLCGKPGAIGRAKKIGEYVRRGSDSAKIEIELFSGGNEPNIIITRNFKTDNTSVWSVDNRVAKENQVQNLVSSLNIRVDNLCQLLPQDRVQDFAKMNPQELLKSTQLAVSGQESIDLFEELVKHKSGANDHQKMLEAKTTEFLKQVQINERLETAITNMKEVNRMKEELKVCTKKKIWSEYEQLKTEVDECTSDKKKAIASLKQYEKQYEPLQKRIEGIDTKIKVLDEKRSQNVRNVSILKNKMNSKVESIASEESRIAEIKSDLQAKAEQQRNRFGDIERAKAQLSMFESDRDNMLKTVGNESKLNSSLSEIMTPISSTNRDLDAMRRKLNEKKLYLESKVSSQITLYQIRLNSLKDAGNKRLQLLKNINEDTYKALLWFRENKSLFKHPVYEPMMMELNFAEPHFAKYLENTVAVRDLIAFTFENSEDMNLFIRKVRGELKLNMTNAVCSSPTNNQFSPPIDINDLKPLGFFTYLINVISGPRAILDFLCRQFSIHTIPIGNDKTYQQSQNVPRNIRFFYSANHRFVIKISHYSGAKSTSTSEVRPARILESSYDYEAIKNVENELRKLHGEKESTVREIDEIVGKIHESETKLNSLISKKQKLRESLDGLKTILSRVRLQKSKIENLENQTDIDLEKEKRVYKEKLSDCLTKLVSFQEEIYKIFTELSEEIIKSKVINVHRKNLHDRKIATKGNLDEIKRGAADIERIISEVERKLSTITRRAKEKLAEAKAATGQLLPHERGFPLAEEFSKLPCTVDELSEHIATLKAKIDCIDIADEGIMEEFKNREIAINKLRDEINRLSSSTKMAASEIEALKNRWLPPLEKQIHEINKRFSDMFEELGCAGEVKLNTFGADDDYDKYGIDILVKFREEEKLSRLTHRTQSGGERALATALYLMALQQLSQAPFRCVDEVNQGMDPVNERKMFQLLTKITSKDITSSQYFILTPKLLFGLDYPKYIKIHSIMNGARSIKNRKWNFKNFLNKSRQSLAL